MARRLSRRRKNGRFQERPCRHSTDMPPLPGRPGRNAPADDMTRPPATPQRPRSAFCRPSLPAGQRAAFRLLMFAGHATAAVSNQGRTLRAVRRSRWTAAPVHGATRGCSTASCSGTVGDCSAMTTASTSAIAASAASGTPIVCTTRMPPLTRLFAWSVAPVKSSAMQPRLGPMVISVLQGFVRVRRRTVLAATQSRVALSMDRKCGECRWASIATPSS